jgi:hypothetical protein
VTSYSTHSPTSYPQNPNCPNIRNSAHVCSEYCWRTFPHKTGIKCWSYAF